MENLFKVLNTQLVIEIEPNTQIRKRVFEFEEKLKDFFNIPFRIISIPDNFDPSIPRFESQSKHGHSLLQVSGTRLTLLTLYDNKFQGDLDKIREYVVERARFFSDLLRQEKKLFIAFIIQLGFEMDYIDINEFIKKNTGVFAMNSNTVDFNLIYSFPFNEKYYLNVTASKYIPNGLTIENNSILKIDDLKKGISISLDINSKLHLAKGHVFDERLVDEISSKIFSVIRNNQLENYLKGEIDEN